VDYVEVQVVEVQSFKAVIEGFSNAVFVIMPEL
jgi:hypothetical protein